MSKRYFLGQDEISINKTIKNSPPTSLEKSILKKSNKFDDNKKYNIQKFDQINLIRKLEIF